MRAMTEENFEEVSEGLTGLLSAIQSGYQTSKEGIQGVLAPLELLNTGALFSETVCELREALLDGIYKRHLPGTFLSAKKITEAENPSLIGPLTEKESMVQSIKGLARSLSERLENHRWNEHFLVELGEMQQTGEPFAEKTTDSFQVLQIKKLVNALYHLELGLKAIESEDLKGILDYLTQFFASEEVKNLPNNADARTWSGYFYDWYHSLKVTPNIVFRVKGIIDHIYRTCDLVTHIEPEFLGPFGPEFAWIKKHLGTKDFSGGMHLLKKMMADNKGFDTKFVYLQGLLLDQLRPTETGGPDLSLLAQLATVFGGAVDEKTQDLQAVFSDSDKVFLKLKSLVSGYGVQSDVFDKFEAVVSAEIKRNPKAEKKRLEQLNQTVSKLTKAFERLSGNHLLLPLDLVHYGSIAWYASCLISDLGKRTTALSGSSQQAIREVATVIRDHALAEVVGFADKAEEAGLCEAERLTKPLITQLEKQYKSLVEETTFAGLDTVGPLQSDAFTKKRFNMAKKRRVRYMEELFHIETILMPALTTLTKSNPSALEREQMVSIFKALQPHIEAVDAGFSNKMLKRLSKAVQQSAYPVISTYTYPVGYKAEVEAIRIRLNRLIATKKLAIQINKDVIEQSIFKQAPALREPFRPLSHKAKRLCQVKGLPACTLDDLKPAPERQVKKYLVWDNAEGVGEDGEPDATKDTVIKKAEKLLDTAWGKVTSCVDPDGDHTSPLSLTHVANTLKDLKTASEVIQNLNNNHHQLDYVAQGTYVAHTLGLFNSCVNAFNTIQPFGMALYSAYQSSCARLQNTYEGQTKHYQYPAENTVSDWAYSVMHGALTGPAHFKALSKGQPELPAKGKKEVEKEARVFSEEAGRLAEHANKSWWFVRYPLLACDTVRILSKRVMGYETLDKQALHAVNNLSSSAYNTMMAYGLKGLNTRACHELLCAADEMERSLDLVPGSLSIPLEAKVDEYMKAFLDPLSVPSKIYLEVRVNEASYKDRYARMPQGSSQAIFFQKRLNAGRFIKEREQAVREEAIDRKLDLELMRIKKSKDFQLKYADKLYLAALREAIRPAVQKDISGEGGFSDRVFDVMYNDPTSDLAVFDRGLNKGSCRLDAMRASISKLEAYLKPSYEEAHGFLFYLFEDKETHAKKLRWVKQLRLLADNQAQAPSARIQLIQGLLSSEVLQKDMQTYGTWFSLAGLARCVVLLLSFIGLCSSKTAGIEAVDNVVRAADMTVSELQVFDELYAKDYRRLDAMLEQVKTLEHYLYSKLNKATKGRRRLFEDAFTRVKKREWVKQLRDIAEDMTKTPAERIDAMRDVMRKPQFKADMLDYGEIDNCFTLKVFKRAVLWLLSLVGLYTLPCAAEQKALERAVNPDKTYLESPLINVGLFSQSAPSTDRNYTAESACEKLGFTPAA